MLLLTYPSLFMGVDPASEAADQDGTLLKQWKYTMKAI